jgi:hypothetical protein
MMKEPEQVSPDPRWQSMVGRSNDLQELVLQWPTSGVVPERINEMLRTTSALFGHHYFVYEFGAVAVVWSLLALEAALCDRFP